MNHGVVKVDRKRPFVATLKPSRTAYSRRYRLSALGYDADRRLARRVPVVMRSQ